MPSAPPLTPPLRAEVDLRALRYNARALRRRAEGATLVAVVKADAYGHGALPVVRALLEEGVERFAVAGVAEGIALREGGVEAPLLVMMAPLPEMLPAYARYNLAATVATREGAEAVASAARRGGPLTVHVKVDTGLHRLGLAPADVPGVLRLLQGAPGVAVEGLWTHFATADEPDLDFAYEQLALFDALVHAVDPPPLLHLANSGGLLQIPEAVEGRALVRVGGALYGLPASRILEMEAPEVRPVMRLVTRVLQVKTVERGETVSYGRTWTASGPTRIATLAVGYGDGYPRSLSNRGHVAVRGRLYPIAGRVCMDLTMLDLGPPDGPGGAVRVGDEAVLFGSGGPSALDVAEWADTISYALTCGLTARVPRVYVGAENGGGAPA
ncbi:MAG TPA: alanine racemase [Rubricoccaceae bacterium]|nr:alanine racemase [Rubricoccaceae bacterium]